MVLWRRCVQEAQIVIASLVRSNERGAIGFLKEPQRINVLVSRARDGLFLIGNRDCLLKGSRASGAWRTVLEHLPVLTAFPARCEVHGTNAVVREAGAFDRLAPSGGCPEACGTVLDCGHQCPLRCHSTRKPHGVCTAVVECRCAMASGACSAQCSGILCITIGTQPAEPSMQRAA